MYMFTCLQKLCLLKYPYSVSWHLYSIVCMLQLQAPQEASSPACLLACMDLLQPLLVMGTLLACWLTCKLTRLLTRSTAARGPLPAQHQESTTTGWVLMRDIHVALAHFGAAALRQNAGGSFLEVLCNVAR